VSKTNIRLDTRKLYQIIIEIINLDQNFIQNESLEIDCF